MQARQVNTASNSERWRPTANCRCTSLRTRASWTPAVAYYIQGGDKSIYFTGRGVTFALTDALTGAGDGKPSSEALVHPVSYRGTGIAREIGPRREAQRWVVKLDFVDANPSARPVGQEPTAAVISYFKGPREEWTTAGCQPTRA